MKILFIFVLLILSIQCSWWNEFYNDGFSIKMTPILRDGGFTYFITVLTSQPSRERNCLIHFNDSLIYVNYNPRSNGENTASQIHPVFKMQETFQIGDFEGTLPVIYNQTYVDSFNVNGISCIIGFGAGNNIFKNFRIMSRLIRDKDSNSGNLIQCDLLTNELCSFNVDVMYNGSIIGTNTRMKISSMNAYTLLPTNIFNAIYFDHENSSPKEWKNIQMCLSSDSNNCVSISADIISISVYNFKTTTIQSYDGDEIIIGLTVFQEWDVAYSNSTVKIKDRAIVISNMMGSQIISIVISLFNFYLLLTPIVDKLKIPERKYLFHFFKNVVQGLFCIIPIFIFGYPRFYYNVIMETHDFFYFLVAYQMVIGVSGICAVLFSNIYQGLYYLHIYLPLISSWNLSFYYSLLDFVEGNPTWGQMILFIFVIVLNYTFCFFLLGNEVKHTLIHYLHFLFWFVVASMFSVWGTTYFIIPPTERFLRLFSANIAVMYVVVTLVTLFIARFFYVGMNCMILKVHSTKIKML